MGNKFKVHGALKEYLYWPVALTMMLIVMNLSIYFIDVEAGILMSIFVFIYFIITVVIFIMRRDRITSELVRYAMDFGQLQKRLLKELALPMP